MIVKLGFDMSALSYGRIKNKTCGPGNIGEISAVSLNM